MDRPRPTTLRKESRAWVYCPICTHTVEGPVVLSGRIVRVKPGEKCPRCSSSLEAGSIVALREAA
jgi:hypothetical protein